MEGLALSQEDVPSLLVGIGDYVKDLQEQRTAERHRADAAEAERLQLEAQLAVVREEGFTQTVNLKAEVARLKAQLEHALQQAGTRDGQPNVAKQALAEQRAAAEATADGAAEAAALGARLAAAEARCMLQERQLEELPVLQARVNQQAAELKACMAQQAAAEQRHCAELEALVQERDKLKEAYQTYRGNLRLVRDEYRNLKASYRRRTAEMKQMQAVIEQLQASGDGVSAQAGAAGAALGVAGAAAEAAPAGAGGNAAVQRRPSTSLSRRSEETGSGSEQLFVSDQVSLPQRLPSVSSSEAELQRGVRLTPTSGAALRSQQPQRRPGHVQQLSQPGQLQAQLAVQQVQEQQQEEERQGTALPSQLLSPVPPALADPPPVMAPLADAWPAEELPPPAAPAMVPPTEPGDMPGSDGEEEDVDVTQEEPTPADPVICTQQPPPVQHPAAQPQLGQERQRQQQQAAQQSPRWHARPALQQTVPQGKAGAEISSQRQGKRPLPPEGQQPKQPQVDTSDGAPEQQQGRQRRRRWQEQQQQQPPAGIGSDVGSPLAGVPVGGAQQQTAAAAATVAAAAAEVKQQGVLAAPWPSVGPNCGQPAKRKPQLPPGGGWKPVVRTSAAQAAFELGPDGRLPSLQRQAPQRGTAAPSAAQPRPGGGAGGGGGDSNGGCGGGGGNGRYMYIPPGEPGYKYQAVVRKKALREKLQAVECQQCHRFYGALESWGTIGQQSVRLECGHVQKVGRDQLRQEGSRHRYLYKPPETQEGFWNMDITQEPPKPPPQATDDGEPELDMVDADVSQEWCAGAEPPCEAGEVQAQEDEVEQQQRGQERQGHQDHQAGRALWVWRAPDATPEGKQQQQQQQQQRQ